MRRSGFSQAASGSSGRLKFLCARPVNAGCRRGVGKSLRKSTLRIPLDVGFFGRADAGGRGAHHHADSRCTETFPCPDGLSHEVIGEQSQPCQTVVAAVPVFQTAGQWAVEAADLAYTGF